MSLKTKNRNLIVEDVISAIYAGSVEGGPTGSLQSQVKRASVELSRRKATHFTKKLLDSLTENPDELIRLEALVVLGFAHPEVMRKFHIALSTEGRRLGILLEKAGRSERAQEVLEMLCSQSPTSRTLELELAGVMRRSGKSSELIERYMERAQEHISKREMEQAVPWLREVLALDRSRKDVARMIRDATHHEANRANAIRSNQRFIIAFLFLACVLGALGYREWNIQKTFVSFEAADTNDLGSISARLGVLEEMRDSHKVWLGRNRVDREIKELKSRDLEIRAEAAERVEAEHKALMAKIQMAGYYRLEGLKSVDLGDWSQAIKHFEQSLENAPNNWEHRTSLTADIAALKAAEAGQ